MHPPVPERLRQGLLLAVCLCLCACTQWRYELGEPLAQGKNMRGSSGESLADVLQLLGPPLRVSAREGGFILAWEHWVVKENSLGISLGAAGADFLSLDWGEAEVAGEFLLLTFDSGHRLVDAAFSHVHNDAGGGVALQPFVGVAQLTDIDDLVDRMPHHDWGAAWLRRLPESLNTPSRPDMGQSGIQQRGTPVGVGQQSLEMD